jgi:hypothetical protein
VLVFIRIVQRLRGDQLAQYTSGKKSVKSRFGLHTSVLSMAEWFLLGKHDLNESGGKTRKTPLSSVLQRSSPTFPAYGLRGILPLTNLRW